VHDLGPATLLLARDVDLVTGRQHGEDGRGVIGVGVDVDRVGLDDVLVARDHLLGRGLVRQRGAVGAAADPLLGLKGGRDEVAAVVRGGADDWRGGVVDHDGGADADQGQESCGRESEVRQASPAACRGVPVRMLMAFWSGVLVAGCHR
jgi:hypothetical protein